MKKKVLMSIVLLAIIGTSAVFAQQPTLDKLKFSANNSGYTVTAANKQISGAVVIPDTYNGKPVTRVYDFADCTGITSVSIPDTVIIMEASAFLRCTGLTSVTIPASITTINFNVFRGTNLTSVTFQGGTAKMETPGANSPFDGDLVAKYKAGGAGTYTRQAGGTVWTKQGGSFTLNGTWRRSDGMEITITENGQNITITGDKPNNGGKLNDTYAKR